MRNRAPASVQTIAGRLVGDRPPPDRRRIAKWVAVLSVAAVIGYGFNSCTGSGTELTYEQQQAELQSQIDALTPDDGGQDAAPDGPPAEQQQSEVERRWQELQKREQEFDAKAKEKAAEDARLQAEQESDVDREAREAIEKETHDKEVRKSAQQMRDEAVWRERWKKNPPPGAEPGMSFEQLIGLELAAAAKAEARANAKADARNLAESNRRAAEQAKRQKAAGKAPEQSQEDFSKELQDEMREMGLK